MKNLSKPNDYENLQLSDGRIVAVRKLPVRRFADLAMNVENEARAAEIFTDLAPAEIDELPYEDFVAILKLGEKLNYEEFTAWLKRKVERAKKFNALGGED
ncbi:MAG: hypothetical protein IKS15_02705 [Opitutales bacterium]|nr:hypothetical protein [Opitutales bacterium]